MNMEKYLSSSSVGKWTILSGIVAFVSYFLVVAGFNFNFEIFSNPLLVFETEGIRTSFLRWSMITDMFGYYLLLLPVLFYFYFHMKEAIPWSSVTTLCGIGYILIGCSGAAILAVFWPSLIDNYPALTADQQETARMIFSSVTTIVMEGMWNLLNSFLSGIWFLGIAFFLKANKSLYILTLVLSLSCVADFLGNMLGVESLAEMGLNIYLILLPIWAIVTGFNLIKKK